MKMIDNVSQAVGATPLLRLNVLEKELELNACVAVKIESGNPGGSIKDRAALYMIEKAEADGLLGPGSVIIEPTSGNTGIGLAAMAAPRGYRVIFTMPDSMSMERRMLLAAYGAELILTPAAQGMGGAVKKAEELAAEIPGSFIPSQFENPANAEAHYRTTGPEIWEATDGKVDILVAGVGTGGTITGIGRYLKEKKPQVRVIAMEPDDSPLLSKGVAGSHKIQGIGANFVPGVLEREILDEVVTIKTEDAYAAARLMARREGVLAGISGGGALHVAITEAKKPENAGKLIVAVLPDGGERYLSGDLYRE
ncbi:MAG: cysteine synthase A [Clostridia bacterium]|nr:cysteine synthase A [Clostridia bacterium]